MNEYGSVTITCRHCGSVCNIEDAGNVERMTGHTCPNCGTKMQGRELAWFKAMYYLRLSQGTKNHPLGVMHRDFKFNIDFGLHYR